MEDRDGRVLMITGASTGIGAATARAAAAAGMRVSLGARSLDKLEALAEELNHAAGAEVALPFGVDVNDWEAQQAFTASTLERFGRLDAVLVNAGFGATRGYLESTPEHWRDMVLTNIYGAALTIRATLPAILESTGHVLVTSSVAGRRPLPGSLYSATKHAVTAMAETLRLEVADRGVRVTSVEPGMTDTPCFDDGVPEWSLEAGDIAEAIVYALEQPDRVNVSTITVRPARQVV